jgi:hypothetical protein
VIVPRIEWAPDIFERADGEPVHRFWNSVIHCAAIIARSALSKTFQPYSRATGSVATFVPGAQDLALMPWAVNGFANDA